MASLLVSLFEKMFRLQKRKTIDSLPNEILRIILVKLDAQPLIGIRGVCKRWKATIEDICEKKTSMVLHEWFDTFCIHELSHEFNQLIDLNKNNYAVLKLGSDDQARIALSKKFCALLSQLFPRIKNLFLMVNVDSTDQSAKNLATLLKNWSSTIVTLRYPEHFFFPESQDDSHLIALSKQIDNLPALKRLAIGRHSSFLKPSTLAQLEHCSLSSDVPATVVTHLGEGCTSLYVKQINQVPERLLKSVTHLGMYVDKERFSFVCSNFGALQMLNIRVSDYAPFNACMIGQLAQLSKLSQLSIELVKIDLPLLAQSLPNLPTLNTIRILTLSRLTLSSNGNQFDGDYDQLGRVLAHIFPNVEQLDIELQFSSQLEISHHMHHFTHLHRPLSICFVNPMGYIAWSKW